MKTDRLCVINNTLEQIANINAIVNVKLTADFSSLFMSLNDLEHLPFSPAPNVHTVRPSFDNATVCALPVAICPTQPMFRTKVGTF